MSQGSYQVPTGGSESATTFAGQVNVLAVALASKNSGPSAPANGPGTAPVQFQDWMDTTTALFPVDRLFDGVNFPRRGTIDIASSIYCPQLGGGLSSILSAATCDIGAKPGTFVTITGVTTINSFGTAAANGEMKLVYCGGQFQITNSANLICPGGQNIITTVGDTFMAAYQGGGVWLVLRYEKSSAAIGMGLPTGAMFFMYGTGVVPGAVRANGGSIGNTGSNATEGSGPAFFNLFVKVWNESAGDTEIIFFTSAAVPTTRGASAAADWAALKRIVLPDMRGRAPFGIDSGAGRITSTTASPDGNTCGAVAGAQVVTLAAGNMPVITPTGSVGIIDPQHLHVFTAEQNSGGQVTPGANAQQSTSQSGNTNNASTGISATFTGNSFGSATPVNKMPPAKLGTWYLAL